MTDLEQLHTELDGINQRATALTRQHDQAETGSRQRTEAQERLRQLEIQRLSVESKIEEAEEEDEYNRLH